MGNSSGGSSGSSSGGSSYRRDTSEDAKWNRAFAKVKSNNARSKAEDARLNAAFNQLKTQRGVTSYNVAQPSTTKYNAQIQSEQDSQLRLLGSLYNQAVASGDTAAANSYHLAANKIREAKGLQAGVDYDAVTGASLSPQSTTETTSYGTGGAAYGYPEYQAIDNSALYEQQAAEKAASIRAAVQRQKTSALGNIQGLESQYGTAVQTAQNQGAQLPGQFTQLNNQASNRGMVNAQRIRTAMAQMGLGQSGASGSEQLEQRIATDNQINSNNQELQNLTTDISTQVSGLQGEKAAKIASIQQAIADAEASGDEQAALALSNAQAQITSEANQNAVARNNWNLSIADKIRAAKESASENAWNQSGFSSAYDLWKAQQAAQNEADAASSATDLANQIKIIQEQAKYRTSGSSGSSGGLTANKQADLEANSLKSMNDWVTKQVAADSRLLPDYSNYATLYDAWKTMYAKMNYGG